jgi:glycosyltransferase involved in cell wall biosynthesis
MTEKKMRVLFVADASPTRPMSGAERVLYEHVSRMGKGGHEIHCLARTDGKEDHTPIKLNGAVVHHFRGVSSATVPFFVSSLWRCRKAFKHLLRNNAFDIINLHQPLSAMGILMAYRGWKIPKVYTFL